MSEEDIYQINHKLCLYVYRFSPIQIRLNKKFPGSTEKYEYRSCLTKTSDGSIIPIYFIFPDADRLVIKALGCMIYRYVKKVAHKMNVNAYLEDERASLIYFL